jgi:hypothetical protein
MSIECNLIITERKTSFIKYKCYVGGRNTLEEFESCIHTETAIVSDICGLKVYWTCPTEIYDLEDYMATVIDLDIKQLVTKYPVDKYCWQLTVEY